MSESATETEARESRFPSLAAMRRAHEDLVKRARGEAGAHSVDMKAFLTRGRASGALLGTHEERWAAQALLDYWVTALYRQNEVPADATLAEFEPDLAPDIAEADRPYVGLAAFREETRGVFFGRDGLVDVLLERLRSGEPLIGLVGPSGSGKSSVIAAGLIPALKAGAIPGSAEWRYFAAVPGAKPLHSVLSAVLPGDSGLPHIRQVACLSNADLNVDAPGVLAKALDAGPVGPAFVFVDQFEEAFALCASAGERRRFLKEIAAVAQSPGSRHRVALTIRSDFAARAADVPEFDEAFRRGRVDILPLDARQLQAAIVRPAALVGLHFEDGLVDRLVQETVGEPTALPLLQFALLELWRKRNKNLVTWAAYKELGSTRQALARAVEARYAEAAPEDQAEIKRILLRLVRVGDDLEVTSAPAPADALRERGVPQARTVRVLSVLVDRGFLRRGERVELAHEALIRGWPRLIEWIEREHESGRHARTVRRLRRTILALTMLVLFAAYAVGYAENARTEAETQRARAEIARMEALRERARAEENLKRYERATKNLERYQQSLKVPAQATERPTTGDWCLWPVGSTLRVRFLDGNAEIRDRVMRVANEWTRYANLRFEILPPGAKSSDVRISFAREGSWGYQGTDARRIPENEPTVNFGWLTAATPEEEVSRDVLHQFGHVLDLIHEHQNPNANIPWNRQAVLDYYRGRPYDWTEETVRLNIFEKYGPFKDPTYRPYDPRSVMHYPIPKEFVTDSAAAVGLNSYLSDSDKEFVRILYPGR